MGTRLSIVLPGKGKEKALDAALSEAQRLEQLLNRHKADSPLAKLNAGLGCKDSQLFDILKQCQEHKSRTLGYFDVNLAGLMALWKIEHGSTQASVPPSSESIKQGLHNKQQEDKTLLLAIENGHFPEGESCGIDLGGFAKGYATDCMVDILKAHEISDAFISFGESSITGLGNHPAGKSWPVSVRAGQDQIDYRLSGESLSISGNFARGGSHPQYGHIICPSDGQVALGCGMAIVKAPTATKAEVLSTALLACRDVAKQKAIGANYIDCKAKLLSLTDETVEAWRLEMAGHGKQEFSP
jgi:thiamine biosynthesis lipoprotein